MDDTKILVVDDEGSISLFLMNLLEMRGFRSIECAGNGREGVEKFLSSGADIVLMDVDMPVMNGYEASKAIKTIDPEANIILMTGRPNGKWAIQTLAEGLVSTILIKPFVFDEVIQAIDFTLDHRPLSPLSDNSMGIVG
jgi:DNA-binding NtrC family response regulator